MLGSASPHNSFNSLGKNMDAGSGLLGPSRRLPLQGWACKPTQTEPMKALGSQSELPNSRVRSLCQHTCAERCMGAWHTRMHALPSTVCFCIQVSACSYMSRWVVGSAFLTRRHHVVDPKGFRNHGNKQQLNPCELEQSLASCAFGFRYLPPRHLSWLWESHVIHG